MKLPRLGLLSLLCLLTLPSCDGPQPIAPPESETPPPTPAPPAQPLLPTETGTTWTYQVTTRLPLLPEPEGELPEGQLNPQDLKAVKTMAVEGISLIGEEKTPALSISTRNEETRLRNDFWNLSPEGLHYLGSKFFLPTGEARYVAVDPAIPYLKTEMEPGMSWEVTSEVGGAQTMRTFDVIAQEEVEVPAGTFEATQIRVVETRALNQDEPSGSQDSVRRFFWFVPGKGFVRSELEVYQRGNLVKVETEELLSLESVSAAE
ncbi:MAG: hypothetical protein AAF555_01100 [Verrucomicrobiota bacterium]